MKLAVVVGAFPALSETFIVRDLLALHARGADIRLGALTLAHPPFAPDGAAWLQTRLTVRPRPWEPRAWQAAAWWRRTAPERWLAARRAAAVLPGALPGRWQALLAAAAFARAAPDTERILAHFALRTADVGILMGQLLARPVAIAVHAHDLFVQPPAQLACRLRRAAAVIACTGDGRRQALAACPTLSPACVHLIHHGLPLAEWPAREDPGTPTLVAIGRLEPKKGFDALLEALALLRAGGRSIGATIIGAGRSGRALRRQARRLGLGPDCLTFAGACAPTRVRAICRQAAVCVLPARLTADGDRDGIPNALLEAQAMGLPVVASAVGGIPELITDESNGLLVPAGQPQALADRIARLLDDSGLRRRLGAAGRQRVEADFDPDRTAAALWRTLDALDGGGER